MPIFMRVMLRDLLLIVHFSSMILGLGQVIAIAVLAAASTRDRRILLRLTGFVSWSVPLIFVTGVGLVAMAHDRPETHWWLRLTASLTIYLGYLSGTSRRLIRQAADPVETDRLMRLRGKVAQMAAVTAVIVVLISVKPG